MFLYGKNSVIERLKASPKTIHTIFLEETFKDLSIEKLIASKNIPLKRLQKDKLLKLKPTQHLQGIIAEVDNFKYSDFDDLSDSPNVLIFLDRIYDPQNLGAIMRTAACFGGFSVIIPKHKACEVTETVLHVAQGAENYTEVAMVSNIVNAIILAKKKGLWVMGAVLGAEAKDLGAIDIPFPLALVLGSEGEGVRYGVDKHIDVKAKIPMHGASLSHNVSMACAIFCYEINKQRK